MVNVLLIQHEPEQIRRRMWYNRWNKFLDYIETKPETCELLLYVHGLIDEISGYRSMTAAGYSRESLEQVLIDASEQFDNSSAPPSS